jgi:hypothetical protein
LLRQKCSRSPAKSNIIARFSLDFGGAGSMCGSVKGAKANGCTSRRTNGSGVSDRDTDAP